MHKQGLVAIALAALLGAGQVAAQENESPYGQGYGPGPMHDGYGPGMGQGYGPGMGQGPGSRPGMGQGPGYAPGMQQGYGPGMGQGPGYGPGMQQGYGPGMAPGYGPGMMGDDAFGPGAGMQGRRGGQGPGMMGGPGMMMQGIWALDLTAQQREQISNLMAEQHRQTFEQMARAREAMASLQKLYQDQTWNAEAIGEAYGKMFDARRDSIVSMVQMRNKIHGLLTDEQRQQLQSLGGWGVPTP